MSGLNGAAYCCCIFDGKLIVGGDFTKAGDIAALRIAAWDDSTKSWSALGDGFQDTVRALAIRDGKLIAGGDLDQLYEWSGSAWVGMGIFNGPIHAIATIGTDAYIAGRFDHAGGGAGHLCIVKWTGTSWDHVCAWIEEPNDNAIIYDLCAVGSDLYVGGCFSEIDYVAAANCAIYVPGSDTWTALSAGGINGLSGKVLAISFNETDVFFAGEKMYRSSTSAFVWRWSPGSSTWTSDSMSPFTVVGPVKCLIADGTTTYCGVYGEHAGDTQTMWRVRKKTSTTWQTIPTDADVFDGPVNAMVIGDAGDGSRLFAVGGWSSAGPVQDWNTTGCMGIVKQREGKWIDFAGGVGLQPIGGPIDELRAGDVKCLRAIDDYILGRPCKLLFVGGGFTYTSACYARSAAGWSIRGPRWLQGGLLTSPMPAYPYCCFVDQDRQTVYFGGDIAGAVNDILYDELPNHPDVEARPTGYAIIRWRGLWWETLPDLPNWARSIIRWSGKIIAAGGIPRRLDDIDNPTEWLVETGDIDETPNLYALCDFDGDLWIGGWYVVGESEHTVGRWNGSALVHNDPANATLVYCFCLTHFGTSDELVCGMTCSAGSPVRQWTGSAWDAGVGGSDISGYVNSLAYADFGADGKWLIAVGELTVTELDDESYNCHVAAWDGTSWHALAALDWFDTAAVVVATTGEFGRKRFLLGGGFGKMTDPITSDVGYYAGMAVWTPTAGWSVPEFGGMNAPVSALFANG